LADIFVSYTSSDREWAHWIALELEKLDHVARVHEWEITGSDDIYAWMEKRHDAADRVLCVVSDEYFKAPYSTLERNAAQWQAAAKRPGFVLLVAVKPCKFPTLSDHLRRCELFGLPEDVARLRFRDFMKVPVKPEAVAFPGKVFAVSNIPIRVPEHFLGRLNALAEIDAALKRGDGRVAITTLHGMRGVGKTVLAAAYAERHRADYRATWWVRAETPDTIRADLVSLGVRLGWIAQDEKEEPALRRVRERLHDEGEGLLLIYDNAIDAPNITSYLPAAGAARVLVTSNAHAWRGIAVPVELNVWPKDDGARFLIARAGREAEYSDAEALSEELGGLPLAHEQAAAYCERLAVCFADYLRRFREAPASLLDADKYASTGYHDGLTVAKAFALAMDEAAKMHPAAEPLITYAAVLVPEPIPLFLFSEARQKFGEPLASQLRGDGLDEAVAALRAFALIERETIVDERDAATTAETIRLHRLVRIAAAGRLSGDAVQEARRVLMEAVAAVYPDKVYGNPRGWPRARRLDALALGLVAGADRLPIRAQPDRARVLIKLGEYRHSALAAYATARPLYEQALTIYGPLHPAYSRYLSLIAETLEEQGDLVRARALFQVALAITEKGCGPEHEETARRLNHFANVLRKQKWLAGARTLYERALAITEKAFGPEHFGNSATLNNLGLLCHDQGELDAARPILERALTITEKELGPDHHETAMTLSNLGMVLQNQGDSVGARQLFERALMTTEKVLGPDHPDVAYRLNNLGHLLGDQGDLVGARRHLERAVTIFEKSLGPEHQDTITSLTNLAPVVRDQGDHVGAGLLYRRMLTINEKSLDPENLKNASLHNEIGGFLWAQGDLVGAREHLERALAINEKTLGEHPDTGRVLTNIAVVMKDQGDIVGARPLFNRALSMLEKVLGSEHPDTAPCIQRFAEFLEQEGDLAEARAHYERALAITEKALGPQHPDTATLINNLAKLLQKEALGPEHQSYTQ
jgi:tetratricopeptide (TPR) repeat protein